MINETKIQDVTQIVEWTEAGRNFYIVNTRLKDGSDYQFIGATNDQWEMIKEAEMAYELNNLNIQNEEQERESYITDEELVEHRSLIIRGCKEQPDVFGLCGWCKSYFYRATDKIAFKLTDEEFEATRTDGSSHTACKKCHENMRKEYAAYKKENGGK